MTLLHEDEITTKDETKTKDNNEDNNKSLNESITSIPILTNSKTNTKKQISKYVIRSKLNKFRHLVSSELISPSYLEFLFPSIISNFNPQTVHYNGGIGNIPQWKISCYLEVMDGGVPTAEPNTKLKAICNDLLNTCDELFKFWYMQQHSCNAKNKDSNMNNMNVKRIMTFITRCTPAPGEQALLKHVDGAGKVDGSLVLALPLEEPKDVHSFYGYGGGLTFWDGKSRKNGNGNGSNNVQEILYDTRPGDVAFIDRAVWCVKRII